MLAEMERELVRRFASPAERKHCETQLRTICTDYRIAKNIAYALNTGFPEFAEIAPAHDRIVSICGSSPSLKDTYRNLAGDIWACNDAGWFLIDRGIVPKYVMVWDPQPLVVDCLRRTHPDTIYLVASICDPSVFDLLKNRNVVIWHPWMGDALPMDDWLVGYEAKSRLLVGFGLAIPGFPPDEVVGTSAAVTRSMQFAPLMGYRNMELHGVDSSCENGVVHFEDLAIDKDQWRQAGHIYYRTFLSTPQMNRQIREFEPLVEALMAKDCKIQVHGPMSAAIPWIAIARGWHVNSVA